MATFQDALNAAKLKGQQQQILSQPSLMDSADVDPEGTAKIQQAKNVQDAFNTGAGQAMGTIGGGLASAGENAAADATTSWADKIKQAAQNSNVKVIPSAYDNELAGYAQKAAEQPKFGEDPSNIQRPAPDQAMQDYQTGLRNQAMQERSANQLADRKNIQFQQLLQSLRGK